MFYGIIPFSRIGMKKEKLAISSRSTGRITLSDVAEHAGVSPITVSRALKNPLQVSEKLKEKIAISVKVLGYIPNHAARSLASSESKVITVIFPSLSNAVFPDVLDGLHDTLVSAGYRILLANTHYSSEQEETLVKTMLEQNPDGIIVTGIDQTQNTRELLKLSNTPVVQIMELDQNPIDMNVGLSHFDASYDLTNYLYSLGYKKIGFIGARMDLRSRRRMEGYQKSVLDQNGNEYVLSSLKNTSFKQGSELFVELISKHSDIDAIAFSNDDLAAGALLEATRRGMRIPEDIAIAGFNDLHFSEELIPPLTTVSIPRYEMGKQAAECLLYKIANKKQPICNQINIGYSIVPRQST